MIFFFKFFLLILHLVFILTLNDLFVICLDIKAENAGQKFFDLANLFIHNRDTDGCKILVFLVSKHFKGVNDIEELKRFFIYWLERLERFAKKINYNNFM